MLKFTHSKFELDLENYDITIIEENHWFSDKFFAKSTLPFAFILDDGLNLVFGDLLSYNSVSQETLFEGYVYINGKEHEAILEIEDRSGREVTASLRFGFEELPNYDKKLSELPLDDFEIADPETIYTHAQSVLNKTWPEVSHNFVQTHVEKFSQEEAQWSAFEGVLNKRSGGAFVLNEYDAVNDLQLNRNIMQPQPYLMHVLSKGFEQAGFSLKGEVLEDPGLKTALLSEISSYYSTVNQDNVQMTMNADEYVSVSSNYGTYNASTTLNQKGRYKISGNIIIRQWNKKCYARLKFKGKTIWEASYKKWPFGVKRYKERYKTININVEFDSGSTEDLVFESYQYIYQIVGGEKIADAPILNITISQLAKYDETGHLIPTLILPNEVKLTKCVPDMIFGDLIKTIKNWRNLDIYKSGTDVYMNYIENQLETESIFDLENYEIKDPEIRYQKGKSFLLKFQDVSSDDYTFEQMFIDLNGNLTSGFTKKNDTSEIIINGIPLPIATKNGIITADHFVDDNSLVKLINYDGTVSANGLSQDSSGLLIPDSYELYYKKWLNLRINAQEYSWSFKMYDEVLQKLSIRSRVMAYKGVHIIKHIEKDLLIPGIWMVEIKTERLKQTIE